MALALLLIVYLPVIVVVALLAYLMYLEKNFRKERFKTGPPSPSLTDNEIAELHAKWKELQRCQSKIRRLTSKGKSVLRRKDGLFDARSKAGAKLNVELSSAKEGERKASIWHTLIRERPLRQWKRYTKLVHSIWAARFALLSASLYIVFSILFYKLADVWRATEIIVENRGGDLAPVFIKSGISIPLTAVGIAIGLLVSSYKLRNVRMPELISTKEMYAKVSELQGVSSKKKEKKEGELIMRTGHVNYTEGDSPIEADVSVGISGDEFTVEYKEDDGTKYLIPLQSEDGCQYMGTYVTSEGPDSKRTGKVQCKKYICGDGYLLFGKMTESGSEEYIWWIEID